MLCVNGPLKLLQEILLLSKTELVVYETGTSLDSLHWAAARFCIHENLSKYWVRYPTNHHSLFTLSAPAHHRVSELEAKNPVWKTGTATIVETFDYCIPCNNRVPTRTGKPGKPRKMGRHFPVRQKSGNFDQTGKVRENHTKYWKTEGISDKYYMLFFSDC